MNPHVFRATFAALSLALLAACGDSAEARELRDSLGKSLEATKALAIKTWDDLKQQSAPLLAEARQQLADVQQSIDRHGPKVSQEVHDAMAAARREIDEAAQSVENAKDAGADSAAKAWQSFREALGHAHDALQKAAAELRK